MLISLGTGKHISSLNLQSVRHHISWQTEQMSSFSAPAVCHAHGHVHCMADIFIHRPTRDKLSALGLQVGF